MRMLKKIEDYIFDLQDKIGEGSFSRVYRGHHVRTHTTVAIKKVRVNEVNSKIARRLLECETSILREIGHPRIIRCHDIHFSVNNCYIVTEYCEGGNVFELLQGGKEVSMSTIDKIVGSVF